MLQTINLKKGFFLLEEISKQIRMYITIDGNILQQDEEKLNNLLYHQKRSNTFLYEKNRQQLSSNRQ